MCKDFLFISNIRLIKFNYDKFTVLTCTSLTIYCISIVLIKLNIKTCIRFSKLIAISLDNLKIKKNNKITVLEIYIIKKY